MAALVLGTAGSIVGGMFGGPVGASVGYLVGSLVGSLIDPPKVEGPRIEDLKLQHSTYGSAVPILYGTKRIAGNVIWQTDLKEHRKTDGGKGGPEVTTYTYTASWAVLLCEGPILGISKMWADGRLINTTGVSNDYLPFKLYFGTEDQLPDPTIEAEEGVGEVPAFRGLAYIVFTDVELGDFGNRIFQLEVETEATGSMELQRVSTFAPYTGNDTWPGIGHIPLMGASLDGNIVTQYVWESFYDDGEITFRQVQFDLTTGETIEDPVPMRMQSIGHHFLYPGYNSLYALIQFSGGGGTFWLNGLGVGAEIIAPLGKDLPATRPLWLDGFLYSVGADGTDMYVGKWGIIDGNAHPTPENEVFEFTPSATIQPANVSLTVDDDGYLYAVAPGNAGAAEIWKIDPATMGQTDHWIAPGMAATIIRGTGYSAVTVFRDTLASVDIGSASPGDVVLYDMANGFSEISRLHPYAYVDSFPPVLTLRGGYALTQDGVIRIRSFETLDNIVADLSDRCGLAGSPPRYDVSDLTERVYGYVLASQMTGKNAIDPLRALYLFDGAEVDDAVLFKHRTHEAYADIPDDELGVHDLGAQAPPLLEHTRTPESELPRTVNLVYLNPDTDYQAATQYARRETSTSELDTSLNVAICMQDNEARERANGVLYSAWVERTGVTFNVNRAWSALVPTDVVTIQGYRVRITQISATVNGIMRCSGLITRAIVFDQDALSGAAPGGGFIPQQPGTGTKAETELVLLDIPRLSADASEFGFYAAMAPTGAGGWSGAVLYKSLDEGVTYHEVAGTAVPSIIGSATTALGDFVGGSPGGGSGGPIGGGALGLPETRVIPGGLEDTVYTMQVAQDCDVTVAMSSGGVAVWVAHGEDSTDWIAYGAGVAYPPLWVLAGDWFSWKFQGAATQDMRPQSQPHGPLGVGAGGGGSTTPSSDDTNTVEVQLHRTDYTLESTNDAGLANGMNKAALRSGGSGALWEIFQFKTATLIGPGLYELSHLLRGVNGTTAYMDGHDVGDDFVLLETAVNVPAPFEELNRPFLYKAVTSGRTLAATPAVWFTNTGEGSAGGGGGGSTPSTTPDFIGDNDESPYITPARGLVPAPRVGDGALEAVLVATKDGTGYYWHIPSWAGSSSGGGFVPTYIAPSETFTVPANKQALWAAMIDNAGILDVQGMLIQVD